MEIETLFSSCVTISQRCDYIPVVSTVTNLIEMALKIIATLAERFILDRPVVQNFYAQHLLEKEWGRSLVLLLPGIGNFAVWLWDRHREKSAFAALSSLSFALSDNPAFMEKAISLHPDHYYAASPRVRSMKAVARAAFEKNPALFESRGRAVALCDRKIQAELEIEKRSFALSYYPEFNEDPYLVALALKGSPTALRYAGPCIKRDEATVWDVLEKDPDLFTWIDPELQDKEDIVAYVVSRKGTLLKHASARLQRHPEICAIAISNNGAAMAFTDETLLRCEDFMARLLRQSGLLIGSAPDDVRKNQRLALIAVEQNPLAFRLIAEPLKNSAPIVIAALKKSPQELPHVGGWLLSQPEILETIIREVPGVAEDAQAFEFLLSRYPQAIDWIKK